MPKLTTKLRQTRLKAEEIRNSKEDHHKNLPKSKYFLGKYEMPSLKIIAEDDPEKDPNYILGHRPY